MLVTKNTPNKIVRLSLFDLKTAIVYRMEQRGLAAGKNKGNDGSVNLEKNRTIPTMCYVKVKFISLSYSLTSKR
ncbi:hypothetical protein BDC45DRAFT_523247 [Circinella umbellata]|nr:hypothetical protein BDC45DRAFT_523247 [Circinella umbellata]